MRWLVVAILCLSACSRKPPQPEYVEPTIDAVTKAVEAPKPAPVPIEHHELTLEPSKPEIHTGPVIRFKFDSYASKPIDVSFLNGAKWVQVTGHACPIGPDQYNDGLSYRRAQAVADNLIKNGVNRDIVHIDWMGERNPLPGPYSLSRRAEISFAYRVP